MDAKFYIKNLNNSSNANSQTEQQNYIRIPINDIEEVTNEEKALIKEHVEDGTIFDCIIEVEAQWQSLKVIGFNDVEIFIYYSPDGAVEGLRFKN